MLVCGWAGRSGELRLGREVAVPPARPVSNGGGRSVVDFYNGSGGSDAEITPKPLIDAA
jgi:hypothetical protein